MTIKELIKQLSKYPDNYSVKLYDPAGSGEIEVVVLEQTGLVTLNGRIGIST